MKLKHLQGTAIFILLTAALLALTFVLKADGMINFVFLGLITVVMLGVSIGSLRKATLLEYDFQEFIKKLENGESWQNIEFKNTVLQKSFGNYQNEIKRLNRKHSVSATCDIEEYITISTINQIIRKSSCEVVSGVSTGLGILGTFLGLMLGLRTFNLGADYETMQTSITMLIDGIKTAFLTSIYGVIYSIIFNWVYRKSYQDAVNALEDFYSAFRIHAVPDSQNEMYLHMIESQNQQATIIRDGIEKFTRLAIENQDEKLRSLVREYLTIMNNEVLGGQIDSLKTAFQNLTQSQSEHIQQVNTLSEKLLEREQAFVENTEMMMEFSDSLQNYMTSINQYQEEMHSSHTEMMNVCNTILEQAKESTQINHESMKASAQMERTLSSFTIQMNTRLDDMKQNFIDMHKEQHEQSEKLNTVCVNTLEAVESAEKETQTVLNEMHELQSNQNTYLEQLREDTGRTAEALSNASNTIISASDKMHENYTALSQKLEEDMQSAFRAFDETAGSLAEHFCEVFAGMEEETTRMPKELHAIQQEILEEHQKFKLGMEEQQELFMLRLSNRLSAYRQIDQEADLPDVIGANDAIEALDDMIESLDEPEEDEPSDETPESPESKENGNFFQRVSSFFGGKPQENDESEESEGGTA